MCLLQVSVRTWERFCVSDLNILSKMWSKMISEEFSVITSVVLNFLLYHSAFLRIQIAGLPLVIQ